MSPATRSILLVEDDPLLRHAFSLLLQDAGYDVLEAGSAADAIRKAHEHRPALMLLDLGLPDRPGIEVARELSGAADTGGIRIVALTGRTGARERQECLDAGCTHFFSKPIEPRELLRRLPDLMGDDGV